MDLAISLILFVSIVAAMVVSIGFVMNSRALD